MKFIILESTTNKVLAPNKPLPGSFKLLLSADINQVVTEDLEMSLLDPMEDYPNWKVCLVKCLSTQPSMSLCSTLYQQEIELRFQCKQALHPELPLDVTESVPQSKNQMNSQPQMSAPLSALDQLDQISANQSKPNIFGDSNHIDHHDSNSAQEAKPTLLSDQLQELLKTQVQLTKTLLSQYQSKVSRSTQSPSEPVWSSHQLLTPILLDDDYPTEIQESTNWVLSVRTKILERLKVWSQLTDEQKAQIQGLLAHMKAQDLDIANPPPWLLNKASCVEQAQNYQNFISIYQEMDAQ